jgi:predicted ATPase
MTLHLRSLSRVKGAAEDQFPFTIPTIRHLHTLEFTAPVTFFVGENGSGKSTLLEALALAAGMIAIGSSELQRDESLKSVTAFAQRLKLVWSKRTRKGFFLRAEDFFGYARRLSAMRDDLETDVQRIHAEYQDRSEFARNLALMAPSGQLRALDQQYQGDLDQRSHGESFFSLFKARFVPDGLYLLDEPEAPLSPLRQLAFLSMLKEMVEQQRAQFIIATHSPILMAYPGAVILNFDVAPIAPIAYDDLEHVTLTRSFLLDPAAYLRHL